MKTISRVAMSFLVFAVFSMSTAGMTTPASAYCYSDCYHYHHYHAKKYYNNGY